MNNKSNLSTNCNFDDDDMNNNCFVCIHFIFPIGCMYYENLRNETENTKEE